MPSGRRSNKDRDDFFDKDKRTTEGEVFPSESKRMRKELKAGKQNINPPFITEHHFKED